MHFAAVFAAIFAAVGLQLFGKVVGVEQVKLHGLDVFVMTIEYDYETKFSQSWRSSFLECLSETFHIAPGDEDSHFACACSASIHLAQNNYLKLFDRKPPLIDSVVTTCPGFRVDRDGLFNQINNFLYKFKDKYFGGHRASSSMVTFLFADKNLNNDIRDDLAKWFVEWPNRLFLAIEEGYAGREADLAKNGIAPNHLLNFTVGQCPEFKKNLQHLLCHDEDVPPIPFPCTETDPGSGSCTEGKRYSKRYNVSKLLQSDTICAKSLVDEMDCDCPTSPPVVTTTLQESSSSQVATAAKEEGIPIAMILGIIFTIIAVIAIVAVALYFFVFRRKRTRHGYGGTVSGAPDQSRSVQASMAGQSMLGAKSQTSLSKDRTVGAKIAKAPGSEVAQSPSSKNVAQSTGPKVAQPPSSKNAGGSKKSSHRSPSSKGKQSVGVGVSMSKTKTSPSKVPSQKMASSSKKMKSSSKK